MADPSTIAARDGEEGRDGGDGAEHGGGWVGGVKTRRRLQLYRTFERETELLDLNPDMI